MGRVILLSVLMAGAGGARADGAESLRARALRHLHAGPALVRCLDEAVRVATEGRFAQGPDGRMRDRTTEVCAACASFFSPPACRQAFDRCAEAAWPLPHEPCLQAYCDILVDQSLEACLSLEAAEPPGASEAGLNYLFAVIGHELGSEALPAWVAALYESMHERVLELEDPVSPLHETVALIAEGGLSDLEVLIATVAPSLGRLLVPPVRAPHER